jgi:hypothetical protein
MIGVKISAAISIACKVYFDEVASQTVKLLDKFVLDGKINGNKETPAVKIIPAIPIPLKINAKPDFLSAKLLTMDKNSPVNANIGIRVRMG